MPDPVQPDFAALRQRAQRLQDDLREAQEELTEGSSTGHAAAGLVTARVGGDGRLLDLLIDASVIDPEDPQGLADLVVTAVQHAHQAAIERRSEQLGAVSGELTGILATIRQAAAVRRPAAPPPFPVPPAFPAPAGFAARRTFRPAAPAPGPAGPADPAPAPAPTARREP
ncbi:hypothetical protein GCM10009665_17460 [Kitasatospora nipponensis]|uniref:Nucleoid-associated protein GCM10009665_17460 n=1 Tax=Kitasatospora nipponensis TaxID=258049 RepID=A0ABP4GK38_9ACTN